MAARVNSRFIIIMLAVVSVAAGGVAVLWYWQTRGDSERLVAQGDVLFEQGQYRQAMEHYGRAIRRQPGNVEWVHKLEKAILAQRPETSDGARDLYDRWMVALRLAAEFQASSPDAQLRLIEELHDTARLLGRFSNESSQRYMWNEVGTAAEHMLVRVPEDEPRRAYGLLYRGLGTIEQRRALTPDDVRRAEKDFADFIEAMPNSDRGWAAMARAQLVLEEQARLAGDPRRLEERRQRLAEVMRQAREEVPGGAEVSTAYAMYVTRPQIRPSGTQPPSPDDVEAALSDMVSAVSRLSDSRGADRSAHWLILEAVQILLDSGGPTGLATATRLIEQHLALDEDAIAHRLMLAELLKRGGNHDESEDILKQILAAGPMRVGFVSRMQPDVQTAAAGMLTELEYLRWTQQINPDERLKDMRAAIDRLSRYLTDKENDPRMVRAQARLALMEDRTADAAAGFERLIREGHGDAETLFSSAFCLHRLGEIGLAHERIEMVTSRFRANPAAFILKAELEVALGRFDAAEETVRAYLRAIPPSDADAADNGARMLRTIAARKQGVTFDEDDPVAAALHRAQTAANEHPGGAGLETGRAILVGALENHPEDVRLLAALATLEMNAGATENAGAYLTRALSIAPEHPVLRQLAALARVGDPIDAAVEFFNEIDDEVERNASVLRAMNATRNQEQARIDMLTRRRFVTEQEHQAIESARDRIRRTESIVAEAAARLREIDPDHAVLIDHEFNEAIKQGDWALASQIVAKARRLNTDQMNGLLYEGRFELERRPARPEQAVRAFQQATDLRPFSNTAWRGLAISFQRVGNFREAVRAYEQAHTINPNDAQTIRGYLTLLIQTGDRTRAMRVARDAARVMPGDVEMRELWLELEQEHNNLAVVLDRRREMYRANPGERRNAMRIALMLAQAEPRFDMLRDSEGKPLMSERQWNLMRPSEQRRILEEHRAAWHTVAERIVDDLFARDAENAMVGTPPDLDLVALRASILRYRGDVLGGEKALRDHVNLLDRLNDPERPVWRGLLALSNYQIESGMFSEAVATMRQAQQVQDETTRDADLALADFLFSRGQFEQALNLYEEVQKVSPQRVLELRMVECAVNLRQFDQAEMLISRLTPAAPGGAGLATGAESGDFTVEMLRAMIARGRADDFLLRGQQADAQRQAERFNEALTTAERMSPSNPAPHIVRAQASISEYRRTKQRAHLDTALASLDRAEAVRAGDSQTAMARVEVHREAGNMRAAITELNRVLERSPAHVQARRLLTQLHLDGGNIGAAIESVERAIELHPAVGAWHEMLGNIYGSREAGSRASRSASAAAFRKAHELARTPATLSRVVTAYVSPNIGGPNDRPDFAAALQILQSEQALIDQEPALEAVLAHVLTESGRANEGRQRLARSYKRFRDQIASGARPASDVASWYQTAMPALAEMSTADIEAMIRAAGPGLPDKFDLLWLSRREALRGPQAMVAATDLLRRAADASHADAPFRNSVLFELSGHLIGMGEFSTASEVLVEVVSAMPNNWVARNNLAFLKADRLGRAQAALPHAHKALELRPNDASVLDTVGWVYFKSGDHAKAEEYLQRSLTVSETARTQVHLAEVFIETRRFDAALSRLRRAAELNPDAQTQADIDRLTDDIRTKRASA